MPEITFIIPARNVDMLHRALSMLSFQKDHGFRAVVVDLTGTGAASAMAAEFEPRIQVSVVEAGDSARPLWQTCLEMAPQAEWVCFLQPGVDFTALSVKRMRRCIKGHDGYDVFHWNLATPYHKYRLKTRPDRLFLSVFVDHEPAPLSAFVFRAQSLREAFAADPDAAGMDLAVILSGAKKTGVRSVRWERVGYSAPVAAPDPAQEEKTVRSRLAFFRWSERFFGEEYPLGVGDRLSLFAGVLSRLYPSYSPDELKEDLYTFAVVNGPIRRMKASSALKAALKARQETLK